MISDNLAIAIVSALVTIFLGLIGAYVSIRTLLAAQHKAMNSRLDEYLRVHGDAREAKGLLAGIAQEKARKETQVANEAVGNIAGRAAEKAQHESMSLPVMETRYQREARENAE